MKFTDEWIEWDPGKRVPVRKEYIEAYESGGLFITRFVDWRRPLTEVVSARRSSNGESWYSIRRKSGTQCSLDEERRTLVLPKGSFYASFAISQVIQYGTSFVTCMHAFGERAHHPLLCLDEDGKVRWELPSIDGIDYGKDDEQVLASEHVALYVVDVGTGKVIESGVNR
jgi:hypothetical protein